MPKNPRQIKDKRFKALKKSIEDAPEMLNLRELIVYPHGGKFVAVCGNMRLRACRELGYKELPCKVLDEDTPPEKLREYAIKDNVPFGEDDMDAFANEWDMAELENWGMELNITETQKLSNAEYSGVFYEPKEIPNIRLSKCIDTRKFDAKVSALNDYDLTDEQRETLKMFAYRFIKIDFESVANYYAFNATDEERKAMERLRLVLVDDGTMKGFVEDDLLRIALSVDDDNINGDCNE